MKSNGSGDKTPRVTEPPTEPSTETPTETLSGALGLAIIPDQATIECAYTLARELMPSEADYVLSEGSLPHLTLYHGKLDQVPLSVARDTLTALRSDLFGRKFVLKDIGNRSRPPSFIRY
jgi:hypothetical protein